AQPHAVSLAAGAAAEPLIGGAITASWKALLLRVLRARPAQLGARDRHPPEVLVQRFLLPETSIAVEVAAAALLLSEGELTVLYAVPQSLEHIVGQVISQIS